jgi:hypothetical protein
MTTLDDFPVSPEAMAEHDRQVRMDSVVVLDEHLKFILSLMPWTARGYAQLLRDDGQEIKHKAEDEMAAAAHWMLKLYMEHGPDGWRAAGLEFIDRVTRKVEEKKAAQLSVEVPTNDLPAV